MKIPDTYDELRAIPKDQIPILWMRITHNPTTLSSKNLIRPLWYRIQCMRYKRHLDQKYITRLNKYAKAPDEYLKSARKIKYELKPGTLIRKTYPSLSAAAYALIGMKVSGTDFFGLNNKGLKNGQN